MFLRFVSYVSPRYSIYHCRVYYMVTTSDFHFTFLPGTPLEIQNSLLLLFAVMVLSTKTHKSLTITETIIFDH